MNRFAIIGTIIYLALTAMIVPVLNAQTSPVYLDKSNSGLNWNEVAGKLESKYDIQFFYNADSLSTLFITVGADSILLQDYFYNNFDSLNLNVVTDGKGNYFLIKRQKIITNIDDDFFIMKDKDTSSIAKTISDTIGSLQHKNKYLNTYSDFITKTVVIGSKRQGYSEDMPTISGFVKSSEKEQPISQVTVRIEEASINTTTNDSGFYSIKVPKGSYTLSVSSIGRYDKKYKVITYSSGSFDIMLDSHAFMLEEVVVSSAQKHNVRDTQIGFERLSSKTISNIPVVLGEKDIIKVALLLPGVQTIGEASIGLNVRGSPVDQTLFYINSVPIYNISHLFGFFSAFNSDVVNEFAFYKSNIPVQFGGRLSSIFDISARNGNFDKFSASGGISPVTGRLLIEGPLTKGKSSYLIAVRSTYSDWVLRQVDNVDIKNSNASFGDAAANFSFKLGENDRLKLFAYGSLDRSDLAIGANNDYSNAGAALDWQHKFNNLHSANFKLVYSNYKFDEKNSDIEKFSYKQSFELAHTEFRADLNYKISKSHTLSYGINGVLYNLRQGDFLPLNEASSIQPKSFEPEKGVEASVYLGDTWHLSPKFEFNIGLRYTSYYYLGPKTVYTYASGLPREIENITDTLHFGNNEIIKTYRGLDFRLAGRYLINDAFSVKASYSRLHQNIFLLSNTIAISPTDRWKLCDYNIKPMTGDQLSAGIYKNFLGNSLEASVEAYIKKADNIVDYKDGAALTVNEFPETEILQGKLDAYGFEFMLRKKIGKLSGWVNYTYSSTSIMAKNDVTSESINFGYAYPANYDKPHALNIVLSYNISKRVSFSGNVVYSTGRPITYPTSIYYLNGNEITGFSMRNEFRLPDYFRVDISINVEGNLRKKKFAQSFWTFSIYNLTARKNAYSVYFRSEDGVIKGYKLSIFGTIIPTITYNFKLGNYED